MTAVTAVPSRNPFSGEFVSLYRMSSSLLPATFFRPSPMDDIPYRKSATPHSKFRTIKIFPNNSWNGFTDEVRLI